MFHKVFAGVFIGVSIFLISVISVYADEYKVIRGIIDIHSNISDGLYSSKKIAKLTKEKGASILIFSDSALRKWEYGLWPLRNLIKKTVEENSVLRLGIDKYLNIFVSLRKEFPDLVIISGLEVSPFYYWQGNPLSKNFSLNDWYKQFIVIGLSKKDYQNLPIVGNCRFRFICHSRFNQYKGKQGIKPYQNLIDYVNRKGGLIFWAHPEMGSLQKYKGIYVDTPPYPEDLFLSRDYTGFGVTFTDRLRMTEAGDIWDELLLEYIAGKRKKPVWIIGSLHYEGPSRRIDAVETLFFIKESKQEDILDALRQGRMYVRFNSEGALPVVLEEFRAEAFGSDSVQLTIKGTQVPSFHPIEIELIRNGRIIKVFYEEKDEFTILHTDKNDEREKKYYYRLKINSPSGLILSNPIFVELG